MNKNYYQLAVEVTSTVMLSILTVASLVALGLIGRALWEAMLLGWNVFNIWG